MKEGPISWLRLGSVIVLGAMALACLLALGGFLALQVDSISTWAGRRLVGVVSSDELRIEVDRVTGSWISSLSVTGLSLSATPSSSTPGTEASEGWRASVDSLSLRYRLLPLVARRFVVRSVQGRGVDFDLTLGSGGPESREPADGGKVAWEIRFDDIDLRNGAVRIYEAGSAGGQGGAWSLSQARIRARDLVIGETIATVLDTVRGTFQPSGLGEDWGRLKASGALEDGKIRISSLLLQSPESHVTARGTFPLALDGETPEGLDLTLEARPLHVRDVRPFVPNRVPDSIRLRLRGTAQSLGDTLTLLAEAEANVPGRLEVEAHRIQGPAGPVSQGRIDLDGLDLQGWGLASHSQLLRGTAEAEIVGALTELQGTGAVSLDLERGSGKSGPMLSFRAGSESVSSPWRGDWDLEWRGISVQGDGTLQVAGGPEWDLQGRASYEEVGDVPLLPGADVSSFRAGFSLDGSGASLDSLALAGEAWVDSATVGRAEVERMQLGLDLTAGRGAFDLEGTLAGGRVVARGRADLTVPAGRLLEAEMTGVDLAALLGQPDTSRLSADLRGRLVSLTPLQASGRIRVRPSRYGGLRVDSASVHGEALPEGISFEVETFLPDSAGVGAFGQYRGGGESSQLVVDSVRFAGLNVRDLLPGADSAAVPSTDLNGRGRGRLELRGGLPLGEVTLELDPSVSGTQTIRGGRISAVVDSSRANVDLEIETPEGGISGEGRVENLRTQPAMVLPGIQFQSLDVGSFLGREGLALVLSGSLNGRAMREASRVGWVGEVRLTLEESEILSASLEEAEGTLTLDSGRAVGSVRGQLESGTVRGEGFAEWGAETLSFQGDASLELPNLMGSRQGGRGEASLFSTVEISGEGRSLDSGKGQLLLTVDSARWKDVPLEEGRLRIALSNGIVRLDTLAFESPAAYLTAQGSMPLRRGGETEGRVELRGEVTRADLLAGLVGARILAVGEAGVNATARGALEDLKVEGEGRVTALLFNDLRVQGLNLDASVHRTREEGLMAASARLEVDRVRLPLTPLRRVDLEVTLEEGSELALEGSAVVDDLREVRIAARAEEMPRVSAVRVEAFQFRADQDDWTLAHPTRIDLRNGIEIDSARVFAQGQEVRLQGRLAREGPLDLKADVESFALGTVADLFGYPDLQGTVSGSLGFSGTAESPGATLRLESRLTPPNAPPGNLEVQAEVAEDSLKLDAEIRLEGGQGGRVSASVPADVSLSGDGIGLRRDGALRMEATADSLLMAWFDPLLGPSAFADLQGVASGSVRVAGTPGEPELTGSMRMARVALGIPDLGIRIRDGHARVTLGEDEVRIDSLRIQSGDGVLRGSGAVAFSRMEPPGFDIMVRADQFEALSRSDMNATVSGQMQVSGTAEAPSLAGRVEVARGELYLGDLVSSSDVEPVTLGEEEYRELARVFGYRPPSAMASPTNLWDSTAVDLEVRLGRASWVRQRSNPEMAVQFTGQLDVNKEPGDSLRLLGRVEGVPGRSYVEQFGRRFTLASGELAFRGPPAATEIDLRAEYEVPSRDNPDAPEVVITLDLEGTADDLDLELSSTPRVAASDVVSYLVTGRPANQVLASRDEGSGGGGLTGAGGALALAQVSAAVETYAREEVGLDVVEITTDGLDGVTLLAGRYLSPRLYLGVRQPLSFQRASGDTSERTPNPEVEVELEAVRWLLLNLQAGGSSGVELFVRSRIAYE